MPNNNEDEVDEGSDQGSPELYDIKKKISILQKATDDVKAFRLELEEEPSSWKSLGKSELDNQKERLEKAVSWAFRVCVVRDVESDYEESDYEGGSDEGEIGKKLSLKSLDSSELNNELLSTENAVANAASGVIEDSHVDRDDESNFEESHFDSDDESNSDESHVDNDDVPNPEESHVDGDNESDSEKSDHESSSHEEGDDDARAACFPCPFCYVDIEIHGLCSHFQEEHCFDLKNAVCPLCAANLGKDVIEHFIVQHASSLKRRRKSQKSDFLNGSSAMLGKELSLFLGSATNGRRNAHESAPDPLLSPFVCSESLSDPKGIQQDECSNNSALVTADLKRSKLSLLDEDHEQDNEERRQRAAFVQELILSTIF